MSGKTDFVVFIETVARLNPESAELQTVALRYFLLKGKDTLITTLDKLQFALDCCQRLSERHGFRLNISALRLHQYWVSLADEKKKSLLKTD